MLVDDHPLGEALRPRCLDVILPQHFQQVGPHLPGQPGHGQYPEYHDRDDEMPGDIEGLAVPGEEIVVEAGHPTNREPSCFESDE